MIRGWGSAQRPVAVEFSAPLPAPRIRGATGRPQALSGSIPAVFRLSGQFIVVSLARRAQALPRKRPLPSSLVIGGCSNGRARRERWFGFGCGALSDSRIRLPPVWNDLSLAGQEQVRSTKPCQDEIYSPVRSQKHSMARSWLSAASQSCREPGCCPPWRCESSEVVLCRRVMDLRRYVCDLMTCLLPAPATWCRSD
jgi:hypothetical protein